MEGARKDGGWEGGTWEGRNKGGREVSRELRPV